jgi:hypothetical protein
MKLALTEFTLYIEVFINLAINFEFGVRFGKHYIPLTFQIQQNT